MTERDKPKECKECLYHEDDYVNDDGDQVEGWGCLNPYECTGPLKRESA